MQDFLDAASLSAGTQDTGLSDTVRDFEYFSMLCPGRLKRIQSEVEKACDRLDYRGSLIYDEYPDRVAMEQISRGIARQVSERLSEPEDSKLYTAELRFYRGTVITGNPEPQVCAMEVVLPAGDIKEERKEKIKDEAKQLHTEELDDITALLLFSEIQHRRCRNRGHGSYPESRL